MHYSEPGILSLILSQFWIFTFSHFRMFTWFKTSSFRYPTRVLREKVFSIEVWKTGTCFVPRTHIFLDIQIFREDATKIHSKSRNTIEIAPIHLQDIWPQIVKIAPKYVRKRFKESLKRGAKRASKRASKEHQKSLKRASRSYRSSVRLVEFFLYYKRERALQEF